MPRATPARRTRRRTPTPARADAPVRVLYYALGGGHGHALRGLAVLSRLAAGAPGSAARAPIDAALIAPAAFAPWAAALGVEHLAPPEADVAGWVERLPPP